MRSLPLLALALALLPACPGEEQQVEVIEPEVVPLKAVQQARQRSDAAEKKMQERADRANAVMDE